jgi:hypothetical protein
VAADSNSVVVPPKSDDSTVGIAVGAAIGGLVLIGIVGAVLFFACRSKKPRESSAQMAAQEPSNYGAVQMENYAVGQLNADANGDYGVGRVALE